MKARLTMRKAYRKMQLISQEEFSRFSKAHHSVMVGGKEIEVGHDWKISNFGPPEDYRLEKQTVWSFPDRGDWATHNGGYRGNWSPYIPRNLILKYTRSGEMVLDQMVGSGTTLVECKLLGRNAIGIDISKDAIMVAQDRLNFSFSSLDSDNHANVRIETYVGDARKLNLIAPSSIDLIATHPPYAGIIPYSDGGVPGELSSLAFEAYLTEMGRVAEEAFRVLKPGKICAVLIGDTRKHLHYIPISVRVLEVFLAPGFLLKEDVIKLQHNTQTTREKWRGNSYEFYKIAHEHLYIFRKPNDLEDYRKHKYSVNWLETGKQPQQST